MPTLTPPDWQPPPTDRELFLYALAWLIPFVFVPAAVLFVMVLQNLGEL